MARLTARLKTSTEGLDVIQTVYAFAMALGLTEVFVGSKTFIDALLFGPANSLSIVIVALLLANVIFLGLRFFWVPRNLRHLVYIAAQTPLIGPRKDEVNLPNITVAFHFIMIFVHGAVYYLICTEFEFIVFLTASSMPLGLSMFAGYVVLHVSLLLVNACWIGLVQVQAAHLERQKVGGQQAESPGSVWWRNNLVCSLVALAPFAVTMSCQSAIAQCMAPGTGLSENIVNVLPVSPQQLADLFQVIAWQATQLGLSVEQAAVLWALLVLLLNSAYDLLTTGRSYLVFEDVEWEEAGQEDARPAHIQAGKRP